MRQAGSPVVRIWVWKAQAALRLISLGPGHAELQLSDGESYGLWADQTLDPIDPSPDDELRKISVGYVSKGVPDVFAGMIKDLRDERREMGLITDDDVDAPEVAVFSRRVTAEKLKALRMALEASRKNPPHYCPVAPQGTMNCVTFVVSLLRETGILDCETTSYWPSRLYKALDQLAAAKMLAREDRILSGGRWIAKPGMEVRNG